MCKILQVEMMSKMLDFKLYISKITRVPNNKYFFSDLTLAHWFYLIVHMKSFVLLNPVIFGIKSDLRLRHQTTDRVFIPDRTQPPFPIIVFSQMFVFIESCVFVIQSAEIIALVTLLFIHWLNEVITTLGFWALHISYDLRENCIMCGFRASLFYQTAGKCFQVLCKVVRQLLLRMHLLLLLSSIIIIIFITFNVMILRGGNLT